MPRLPFAICLSALLVLSIRAAIAQQNNPRFTGSESCRKCHLKEYDGWKQTRMANVVRDPKLHPEAVLGDFQHADPNRPFELSQVALVYGSRWKQRYFARQGDGYYPLPAQWDIKNQKWLPYHVPDGADWWVEFYPKPNEDRPTGPTCDGCHSVNYNLQTMQVTEWNVGCEKCHGPGSKHVAHPTASNIVNPEKLDPVRATDVCIQCHSQGRPSQLPVDGKYVDWPVGYVPGQRLADVWNLEIPRLGTQDFYFWQDASAHKNRMQGNDFVQSTMYHRGMRCFDCHQVHSNANRSNLIVTGNALCLGCHTRSNPAGLKGTVNEHTHHAAKSAGSECTACHMPKIAQTLGNNDVSSHTFRFISPRLTQQFGIPNPCTSCHTGKSNEWAIAQLKNWSTTSPWRIGQ
ncbi:MAG: cytochrome c3 family protein [Terracidiphilus sp.]